MMQVSVVLPTYNRREVLFNDTIPALERQEFDKANYEIIIVDDGSNDGTSDNVREYAPKSPLSITLITQKNLGAAAARNQGIRVASGNVIIIIGDDTYPADGQFVKNHYQFHQERKELNIAMLGYTLWDTRIETPFMKWLQDANKQFAYGIMEDKSFVLYQFLYTSNISFKKAFLDSDQKLLDESFKKAAYEDTEWGYRLHSKYGLRIYYDSNARLYHNHFYDPIGFVKRCYICDQEWLRVKTRFPELYKARSNGRVMLKAKLIAKRIIFNRFICKMIRFDIDFGKIPNAFRDITFRLLLQKFRYEQKDHCDKQGNAPKQ